MATLFVYPNAAPVSAGSNYASSTLNFYQPGTTTAISTYTTAALSVAHSATVTADANGVFAPIFVNEAVNTSYRMIHKTAAGATIRDIDNLPAIPSQANIGAALWPRTAAEIAAGVTPTNYAYEPGDYRRYDAGLSLTDSDLAEVAVTDEYVNSATAWSVAISGILRTKVTGTSTITELELRSADSANTGDVFIRFREADGTTKGVFGFTASADDTFSMTSYEDFRLKFRTGTPGDTSSFIDRAFIYGSATASWIGVQSNTALGGCFVRFTTSDASVSKGYVGYTSTTDDDIDILNSVSGGNIDLDTNGGKIRIADDTEITGTLKVPSVIHTAAAAAGSTGDLVIGNGTQSTVGAAGAASALPATPTGFIKIYIGSTQYVIPYYAQA